MTSPNPPVGYYTPKLGLHVDSLDDEMDSGRDNWDKLDSAQGVIWVAADVTPSDAQLYDGAVVAEILTGKVWRAEKDINGNYVKKWIKYPWLVVATQTAAFPVSDLTDHDFGWTAISTADSVNADGSALVNNRVVVPVKGVYSGVDIMRWESAGSTAGGHRWHQMKINNTLYPIETQTIKPPGINNVAINQCYFTFTLNEGDIVCASVTQNSGGAQNTTNHRLTLALVRPL